MVCPYEMVCPYVRVRPIQCILADKQQSARLMTTIVLLTNKTGWFVGLFLIFLRGNMAEVDSWVVEKSECSTSLVLIGFTITRFNRYSSF